MSLKIYASRLQANNENSKKTYFNVSKIPADINNLITRK